MPAPLLVFFLTLSAAFTTPSGAANAPICSAPRVGSALLQQSAVRHATTRIAGRRIAFGTGHKQQEKPDDNITSKPALQPLVWLSTNPTDASPQLDGSMKESLPDHPRFLRWLEEQWAKMRKKSSIGADRGADASTPHHKQLAEHVMSSNSTAFASIDEAAAHEVDGVTALRQRPLTPATQNTSQASFVDRRESFARPHIGTGPEIVVFGLKLQKLHGLDFMLRHFLANLTLTLRWIDKHAAEQVLSQGGVSTVLMADMAHKLMWLPDVKLVHQDLVDIEIISSAVSVNRDGTIQQSMNMVTKLCLNFKTDLFPFDTQSLHIQVEPKISSLNDLVLAPAGDTDLSGAQETAFSMSSFSFLSSHAVASITGSGAKKKSVGEVVINIRRDVGAILRRAILPSVAVAVLSFTVFYVTLSSVAYAVPRIFVSVITIMLQLQLTSEIEADRPMEGVQTWLDVFHESNTILTFAAASLNAFVAAAHCFGRHRVLAGLLDQELRLFLPLLTVCLHIICVCSVSYNFVVPLVVITRFILGCSVAVYLTGCIVRWRSWAGK